MAKISTNVGPVDLSSDVSARYRHLVVKGSTISGQLDIWSALVDLSSDVLPSQNGIFLTFQNCGISDLPHLCIWQYYRHCSEKLYSTVHVHGSYNLSI